MGNEKFDNNLRFYVRSGGISADMLMEGREGYENDESGYD